MSRIHDALKKAQEERAAQQNAQGTSTLDSAQRAPLASATPAALLENPGLNSVATVEQPHGSLTFETLLAKCRQRAWNPNTSALLFSSGNMDMTGMESFRTLRARLYQLRAIQPVKKVLVTSALPSEGKTFVTSNLAQSIIRQHERRALLIDADLRLPNLHTPLGAPSTPGLSDYLLGEVDEFAILQRGSDENLFFIPGGKSVQNPSELLSNGRLERLLERLAPAFDWILLDSPPAIPVADASVLAKMCDGVLMVVRGGSTPYDLAQKACMEFQDRPLLGVVLNRAESTAGYGSYYYNGYGAEARNGKH
jgi:protein-tyrosine kinase